MPREDASTTTRGSGPAGGDQGHGRTVAIVGGGISGLAVAEAIERLGAADGIPIRTIVLEREAAPGGKIKTQRVDGFVVETGPHGFLDKEPVVFELIDRLGLTSALVTADASSARRYIVRGGCLRALPSSPPKFLVSGVLPAHQRFRVLLEPWVRQRAADATDDESVFDFASRRIGRGAAEVLVDAMVTGIFGGDPKALSLRSAFPRMMELEATYGSLIRAQISITKARRRAGGTKAGVNPAMGGGLNSFRMGLGTLTDALAARTHVRVGFDAAEIQVPFCVRGQGTEVRADAVVLATPADVMSGLLEPIAPDVAEIIKEIPYAPVSVVVHAFRRADLPSTVVLDGFGFLIPHHEGREILGTIWASTVFPDHAPEGMVMLRTMVGGARRPELMALDDAEMLERVRAELVKIMRIPPDTKPVFERVLRWPVAIPQYTIGHASRVDAMDRLEARIPGLFATGNAFRGVAMIACIVDAQRVAERVVRHVAAKRT
ncbi:MAG: protoporphyrinogen oxidase [Deltaproteobacteria bacterium]|nr:protoporphyrinogen oxidase [Deltaproteobacteria bacterium]